MRHCTHNATHTATHTATHLNPHQWASCTHCNTLQHTSWGIIHTMHKEIHRCITGWRRSIGCLKLQVSFRRRASNYRALLRKMNYKDKTPYGSLPTCTIMCVTGQSWGFIHTLQHTLQRTATHIITQYTHTTTHVMRHRTHTATHTATHCNTNHEVSYTHCNTHYEAFYTNCN